VYDIAAVSGQTNNPAGYKNLYAYVAANNVAYNAEHPGGRWYDPKPLLVVVGTGILPMSQEGNPDLCDSGQCRSYSLITDLDDDGHPDGAVTWIPALVEDGLATPCNSADEFNAGTYLDPEEGATAAVFIGDCYYLGGCDPEWDANEMTALVGTYTGNNHQVKGVLRETAYSGGWAGAGQSCLEEGVQDLWIEGLATNPYRLTPFLSPGTNPVSREQRLYVFAPDCESLDYWASYSQHMLLREMMFPSYFGGGTLVAGAIGCITAGYSPQHELCRDLLEYRMREASPGTLYANIAKQVMDDLYELDPTYARGLLTLGGIVKYRGGMGIDAIVAHADVPGTRLRWSGTGAGGRFSYDLDGTWNIRLDVYDVGGRHVASVDQGIRTGSVATEWKPAGSVRSGLYFGRLEAHRGNDSKAWVTKVLVLR
jgi:hypothetical protein